MTTKLPYRRDSVYFQYYVTDFSRARKFYGDILGFKIAWDIGDDSGWLEYALPARGAKLGLNLLTEGKVKHGSAKLTLIVTDLEDMKDYLKSKGVKTDEITDVPDMISYFNIKDPDGNPIQIAAEPRIKSE
ncbi:MAG: VOC family protein [Candidatus Thorarchaeota archaeon]|nr:VOC family protein [Candidatus Thorarchaeota archaeon]